MYAIIYKTNEGKAAEILEHLMTCDKDFVPPLSHRIDLTAYSVKLVKYATNFEAWNVQKELVGLVSVYMNDLDVKTAFITNVSVCPEFTGKGIAKRLMAACLKEAKQKGFLQLQLEVNKLNAPAIKLYSAFGFDITEIKKKIIKMNLKLKSNDNE